MLNQEKRQKNAARKCDKKKKKKRNKTTPEPTDAARMHANLLYQQPKKTPFPINSRAQKCPDRKTTVF
jgi:hypothetical protein